MLASSDQYLQGVESYMACCTVARLALVLLFSYAGSCQSTVTSQTAIHAVETDLSGPVVVTGVAASQKTLMGEMKRLHVSAVSIAVVHNGRIEWAKAYGIRCEGCGPVTTETLFQAASITKSVTATAALHLVQEHKLSLDAPIQTELKNWKLPQNSFTAQHPVTLRELLSNTAGTSAHGFDGYAAGETLPTLKQILYGAKPANSVPVVVERVPGHEFLYSGGGFLIAQQAMMDVTGKPFPEVMKDSVLGPIGMQRSTFQQPIDPNRLDEVAYPVDEEGKPIAGGPHVYPEMAAAGLWTTPSDLARWIIAIQESLAGKPGQVLSAASARAMLTPIKSGYGLGVLILTKGGRLSFNHDGSNAGYKAMYVGYESGDGVVVMTNGDNGFGLIAQIIPTLARVYGWAAYAPQPRNFVSVPIQDQKNLTGTFQAKNSYSFEIGMSGNHLQLSIAGGAPELLLTSSATSLFETENIMQIMFQTRDHGFLQIGQRNVPFVRIANQTTK